MPDFDIRKGQEFDLTSVSKSEIQESDVVENNKKLINIFSQFDLNKDGKLNSIELAHAFKTISIFDNINPDGCLSKEELQEGANFLNAEWGLDEKNKIKFKDIQKFVKNILSASEGKVDINDLLPFDVPELSIENVTNAQTITEDGQDVYFLSYDNNKSVKIHQNKSYEIIQKSTTGDITTTYFDSQNSKTKEQVIYSNGDVETYSYVQTELGPILYEVVQVTNSGTQTSTSTFVDGVCTSEVIESKDEKLVYNFIGDSIKLTSSEYKDVNGNVVESSEYSYNDSGHCTITTRCADKTIIQHTLPDLENVYYQKITQHTDEGDVIEEMFFTEDGNLCTTRSLDGFYELNCFSQDSDKKMFTYRIDGDKEYYTTYDGEGNTNLVMTYLDKIGNIAKAAGVTVDELYDLNADIVKGKGSARYFLAGQVIRVPGELDPADKILANRGTTEYEEARFGEWQAINEQAKLELASREDSLPREYTSQSSSFRELAKELYRLEGLDSPSSEQLKMRVQELKELNAGVVDGNLKGKKITVRYNCEYERKLHDDSIRDYQQKHNQALNDELKVGCEIAKRFYEYIDNHNFALGDSEFKSILNEITADNVVGFLKQYEKLYDKPLSELVNDEFGKGQESTLEHIFNMLKERALKSGIDSTNLNNFLQKSQFVVKTNRDVYNRHHGASYSVSTESIDITKFDLIKTHILSQIEGMESISPEERRYAKYQNTDNISLLHNTSTALYDMANSSFEHQLATDGWCADLWEGLKYISSFGSSPNLDENVRKELNLYKDSMNKLKNIYETQGEEAFKKAYQETFGVVFDSNLVESYSIKLSNYNKAVVIDELQNKLDKVFIGDNNLSCCSYNELKNYLNTFLQSTQAKNSANEPMQAEDVLEAFMVSQGVGELYDSRITLVKTKYLRDLCRKINGELTKEKNLLTDSKDLSVMNSELATLASSLYGTKHDVMHRVEQYIQSQEKGEVYVSTGIKALAMIGIGVLTGGSGFVSAGLSGVGTFVSSTAVDMTNEMTGDGLTSDELLTICKDGTINALFAMGATGVREIAKSVFKGHNMANFKTSLTAATGQTGVMSLSSSFKDKWSTGNMLLDFGFAFMANYITGKPIINDAKRTISVLNRNMTFNPGRALRRTGSFAKNEIKVGSESMATVLGTSLCLDNIDNPKDAITNFLSQFTSLGELNRLYASIDSSTELQGENKEEVLAMIKERASELKNDPNYSVVPTNNLISPQSKTNAINALDQPAKHLRQDQISAIEDYVYSVSDISTLYNILEKINRHGLNRDNAPELFQLLDDKFAEFRQVPPYEIQNGRHVLYAQS